MSSDDLLHRRDDGLPGPEVVLGDAVLPHCSMDGDVQGSQVGSRGGRQRPQLILLLLLLMHSNTSKSQSEKQQQDSHARRLQKSPNHDVFLVSLLLDVLVCSLDVLDVHGTELA